MDNINGWHIRHGSVVVRMSRIYYSLAVFSTLSTRKTVTKCETFSLNLAKCIQYICNNFAKAVKLFETCL